MRWIVKDKRINGFGRAVFQLYRIMSNGFDHFQATIEVKRRGRWFRGFDCGLKPSGAQVWRPVPLAIAARQKAIEVTQEATQ